MKNFICRHKWISFILIVIPTAITLFFQYQNARYYGNQLTILDWLPYGAGVLTYFGSSFIGFAALYQAEQANIISKRAVELSKKEYAARFSISNVYYTGFTKRNLNEDPNKKSEVLEFTENPDCFLCFLQIENPGDVKNNCRITIRNIGVHPIVKVTIREKRDNVNDEKRDSQTIDAQIPSLGKYIVEIIDPEILPMKENDSKIYVISCENIYGASSVVELTVQKKINRLTGSELVYANPTCKKISESMGENLEKHNNDSDIW